MASPIQRPRTAAAANAAHVVVETAPRRQLREELTTLGQELDRHGQLQGPSDRMTTALRAIHRTCTEGFNKGADAEKLRRLLRQGVEAVLRDPLTDRPLPEDALLGSDGRAYHPETIRLFREQAPAEYRDRSPCDLNNPAALTTTPHPLVRAIMQWLNRESQAAKMPFASEAARRIQRLVEREQARLQRREARTQEGVARYFAALAPENDLLTQRIEAIRRSFVNDRKTVITLEEAVAKIQSTLEKELAALEKEIIQLRKEGHLLEERLQATSQRVAQAEQDNLHLQKAIQETQQAVKESHKESLSGILTALGTVAACLVIRILLPETIAIIPLPGGAAIGPSIPI